MRDLLYSLERSISIGKSETELYNIGITLNTIKNYIGVTNDYYEWVLELESNVIDKLCYKF